MPNQRKQTKAHLGGYYEKELKDQLQRIAKSRGISLSALVEEILVAQLKDWKRRHGGA